MSSFKITTIDTIEQKGQKIFAYIEPDNTYYKMYQKQWFKKRFCIDLPGHDELSAYGIRKDLRVLVAPITATINFENSSYLQFKFYPGYITDMASVPWFFRSIVDNDDQQVIVAALVHDYLFTTHGLPFEYTNKLFHGMLLQYGYNRVRARLAYWAVASPIAKLIWKNKTVKRNKHTRKTAEMHIPRPIKIDGVRYASLPKLG